MHEGNESVVSIFQLKKGFRVDSGWMELVGWDFLEVPRIAGLGLSQALVRRTTAVQGEHIVEGISQSSNDCSGQPTKKWEKS